MSKLLAAGWGKLLSLLAVGWIFYNACLEFYHIAWGTGAWFGEFSFKWALALLIFIVFAVVCFIGVRVLLWSPRNLDGVFPFLTSLRRKIGVVRWPLIVLLIFMPIYIFQYTNWGHIFHGPYLRILIVSLSVMLQSWLVTQLDEVSVSWLGLITSLVLSFGAYVLFAALAQVTSYPFSLGWSEGNRLWDYSIMFGRRLYEYPADKAIPVYLDVGRQLLGGIPFLFPNVTIWQARLWVALVGVLPYLILGWITFYSSNKNRLAWILAGIWAFTFVKQGPIHPPLLLCAIMVALVWRRPLWIAIPVIVAASLFAEVSRFTWLFAPGMWAVMLEMGSASTRDNRLDLNVWKRAISVGLAGVVGGLVMPYFASSVIAWIRMFTDQVTGISAEVSGVTVASAETSLAQSLLWYRLLPNATFGPGILIALLLAAGPLVVILIHLARTRTWILNDWQKAAIVLPLLAFLVVGLIVSTKIGGGGDLHNLDMFIIGLLFAGAIAWRNGGYQWFYTAGNKPLWIQAVILALIVIPGYWPLKNMRPISVTGDTRTVALLADITPSNPLLDPFPDALPSHEDTLEALNGIQAEVERAAPLGDILFMDQRQLLTFGYVGTVPLVPEYDKKVLIDKALSADAAYFEAFYRDLESHRFSLIISNPLHDVIKIDEAEFGEENNAWVKWVSAPILCYYEPRYTLKKVTVQILVPRSEPLDCASVLPQ